MSIALKEANETKYWLLLLVKSDYFEDKAYKSIDDECKTLIKLLVSIIKKMKFENVQI